MGKKCLACDRGVRSNSKAVQCNDCKFWSHIRCGVLISLSDYALVAAGKMDFQWSCQECSTLDATIASEDPTLPLVESTRLSLQAGKIILMC